ncbi:unnamed protein product [Rotaria sp. Silwood2]|nr:unnamed protein product [Rotaria sp. Silwood2]CAF2478361.1 unnamed protein product [Rotaria sp. Silwood2]CAF4399304.1 unnamed protein product [Rotaria sp. Silwood2]CAF4581609.1 unnamed protein product [Rotaria sp. Silwood2]
MIPKKFEKTGSEYLFSLFNATQKLIIHFRRSPNHNDTIDIIALDNHDDADRPNPLRLPEIIIVLCVLLLWCGSIIIFIRHSELLRIRHRDLPFRSTIKSSINLHHITAVNHTSDMFIHSKSQISSASGTTPPLSNHKINGCRHGETMETISLVISPLSRKRRNTHSFDLKALSLTKNSFDKHQDKEHLLNPHRISSDIKRSLLDLHRKSMDNLYRKSSGTLSSIKYSTFYSTNDISKRRSCVGHQLIRKQKTTQESPV